MSLLLLLLQLCSSLLLLLWPRVVRWWLLLWTRLQALWLMLSLLLLLLRLLAVSFEQLVRHGYTTTAELLAEARVVPVLLGGGSVVDRRCVGPRVPCLPTTFPKRVCSKSFHVHVTVIVVGRRRCLSCRRGRHSSSLGWPVGGVNAVLSPSAKERMSFLHVGTRS